MSVDGAPRASAGESGVFPARRGGPAHHDGHRLGPDLLILLDDAHALEGHEAAVRVRIDNLRGRRRNPQTTSPSTGRCGSGWARGLASFFPTSALSLSIFGRKRLPPACSLTFASLIRAFTRSICTVSCEVQ